MIILLGLQPVRKRVFRYFYNSVKKRSLSLTCGIMMFRTIEKHHAPKANEFSCFRILSLYPYDKLTTKTIFTIALKQSNRDPITEPGLYLLSLLLRV